MQAATAGVRIDREPARGSVLGMVNENPLREGDDAYRTDVATEETEPGPPAPASAPPWIAIGLVVLALLAYAVVLPLLR